MNWSHSQRWSTGWLLSCTLVWMHSLKSADWKGGRNDITPHCTTLSMIFIAIEGTFERRLNLMFHDGALQHRQHHSDAGTHRECPVPRKMGSLIVLQSQDLSPAASFTKCPWWEWTLKALHVCLCECLCECDFESAIVTWRLWADWPICLLIRKSPWRGTTLSWLQINGQIHEWCVSCGCTQTPQHPCYHRLLCLF